MKILPGTPRPLLCRKICPWLTLALFALSPVDVPASRIVNLSARGRVGTSSNVLIGGVTIQGSGAGTFVFRGIGPSLAPYFPAGTVLVDPNLELFNSNGTLLYSNNNWQESQQAGDISATGLAPSNYYESAIKYSLGTGAYTAVLSGVGGGTGIGVVEVYDITPQPSSIALVNISTRARTENSYANEIVGMILQGSGYKGLVLRGLGQSTGVAFYLPNPSLRLYNSSGGLLQYNENWKDTQYWHIWTSGFNPTFDPESAMTTVANLAAGSYTASVVDNSGASGIANLEIYDLGYEIYEDAVPGGGLVVCCNPAIVRISPLLYPQSAGKITVHFSGYAAGTCSYGPCAASGAQLWPELLDANGTVIFTGQSLGLPGINVPQRSTVTFNWTGAPFRIRMMARSNAFGSSPDSIKLQYWDVYTP